jgi:hypothetical protein
MGRLKEVLYVTSGEAAFDEVGSPKGELDAWSETAGCWADVWDDEVGQYRACELAPQADSTLGLCATHEALRVGTCS